MQKKWLEWARAIQAIAQTGLTYADDKYDIERYQQLNEIASEILGNHTKLPDDFFNEIFTAQEGYATPKVDVRGIIFEKNKILLVKEKSDNKWTVPGGWADVNLSPAENVVKEIKEEAGVDSKAKRLLAVYDRAKHNHKPDYPFHVYKIFFECEISGGELTPGLETSAVKFFDLSELPELSERRILESQIKRMHELIKTGNVDFD